MAESKEELKSLLIRVKEGSKKAGLKLDIQKTKIMTFSSITSWQIDGEQWKQWQTILLGSKITADGDCSHEIKRCLLLGSKAVTNLGSVLKSRDITLPIKVCRVKAMVFLVVMYEYKSWTIKKAECWSIDVFEFWCWRRLLRVSWTARRANKSIVKEINPDCKEWCWSWSCNTLATWCEKPTRWKRPWCWERLKEKAKGGAEGETVGYHHRLNGHEFEQTPGDSGGQRSLACCSSWGCRAGHHLMTEQQQITSSYRKKRSSYGVWCCNPKENTHLPLGEGMLHADSLWSLQTLLLCW